MRVVVANCRYEGTQILLPFLLSNLVPDGQIGNTALIWEGQIDTGFSEYLMMPFEYVLRNNLELSNLGSLTVANGAAMSTINTLGMTTLVGRKAFAVINSPIQSTGSQTILIGQKMLEVWNVKLEADPVNKIAQLIALPPKTS